MRLFLMMLFLLFLNNCTTVEVTKEIIKAGTSAKNNVSKIINKEGVVKEKDQEIFENENLQKEKENIILEQEEQKNIVENLQKSADINLLGNSIANIKSILNEPQLAREDGNTYMIRYDSNNCHLFLFFNLNIINKIVEYFEFRNSQGIIIESKESIEECYKEFKLV